MMLIRAATTSDFAIMQRIFGAVTQAGDAYVFAVDMAAEEVREYWFGNGVASFVGIEDGEVLGMYKLIANQRDRGNHVANASFMVAPGAQGRGVGRQLAEDCIERARRAGFRAMQLNFVISTNLAAVRLWTSLGFHIVGTLPGAFRHQQLGFVDAHVMFRSLQSDS